LNRANELVISGRLSERDALRHTPAGVALVNFRIVHESEQVEAGTERKVYVEVACVAAENEARLVAAAPLRAAVRLTGFLAGKGYSGGRSDGQSGGSSGGQTGSSAGGRPGRQLVLHVTRIEFEESDLNLRPVDPAPSGMTGRRRDGDGT
jgi:primosomal replication protein N